MWPLIDVSHLNELHFQYVLKGKEVLIRPACFYGQRNRSANCTHKKGERHCAFFVFPQLINNCVRLMRVSWWTRTWVVADGSSETLPVVLRYFPTEQQITGSSHIKLRKSPYAGEDTSHQDVQKQQWCCLQRSACGVWIRTLVMLCAWTRAAIRGGEKVCSGYAYTHFDLWIYTVVHVWREMIEPVSWFFCSTAHGQRLASRGNSSCRIIVAMVIASKWYRDENIDLSMSSI